MNLIYVEDVICCDQRRRDKKTIKEYLMLNEAGLTDDISQADYIILITCSVTVATQEISRNLIKKSEKYQNSDRVIDIGCYRNINDREEERVPIHHIPPSLHDDIDEMMIKLNVLDEIKVPFMKLKYRGTANPDDRETWFLSIGEGCSLHRCGYCVKYKSTGVFAEVKEEDILNSFVIGASSRYKKFRFIGEDVASWGSGRGKNFPWLVDYLLRHVDGESKRPIHFNAFMNGLNPYRLEENKLDYYEMFSRKDCVFDGIQLAVQSFNKRIIELCERPGNPQKWMEMIQKIKELSPKTELWVQIIVGFPTQTIEEMEYDLDVLDSLPVDVIHIYGYSHNVGSNFYNHFNFHQADSDKMFEYLLEHHSGHKGTLIYHGGNKSLLISRLDPAKLNRDNSKYHRYRGLYEKQLDIHEQDIMGKINEKL